MCPLFVPEEVEQWFKNRSRSKTALSASFFGQTIGREGRHS